MKPIITTLLALFLAAACNSHGPSSDHYYCNKHTSQEKYDLCMEAGEEL